MSRRTTEGPSTAQFDAVELFAGIGGFRLGLNKAGWRVVWANQWEPPGTEARQFAYRCYVKNFDADGRHAESHCNKDIKEVLDEVEAGEYEIPQHRLLVGGFPCQDYSVAKPLNQAKGIQGKKGVLWWEIFRLLAMATPQFVLLENVDRLLKSPVAKRGRDFTIILACFASLGYEVEWRVVNAADYGFPQKRRRVFIYAHRRVATANSLQATNAFRDGVLGRALPLGSCAEFKRQRHFLLTCMPDRIPALGDDDFDFAVQTWANLITESLELNTKTSPFGNVGFMSSGKVWTAHVKPPHCMKAFAPENVSRTLGEVVRKTKRVHHDFLISKDREQSWRDHKSSKSIDRVHKGSNSTYTYTYAEGNMQFPDNLGSPARTVLTSEGGKSASRSKHAVELFPDVEVELGDQSIVRASDLPDYSYRRLTPQELEEISGFPPNHTDVNMTPNQRAFCIGNAVVVGIVEAIAKTIKEEAEAAGKGVDTDSDVSIPA